MKYLQTLLSEDGHASTMRLMSLMSCSTAIVISIIGLFKAQPDYSGLSMLCGTFLAAAFAGKALQKPSEAPISSSDKPK